MNTTNSTPETNPMDRADLPLEVRGFDRESYLAWKFHPMSRAVFRYYQDHREALIREHRDWWLSNTEPAGTKDLEARLRAQIEQDIIELSPDAIIRFYTGEEPRKPPRLDDEPSNLMTEVTGY